MEEIKICGNCKYFNEHIANRVYTNFRMCKRTYQEKPFYVEWVFYSSHPCDYWERKCEADNS